jgi:hypothetical protein
VFWSLNNWASIVLDCEAVTAEKRFCSRFLLCFFFLTQMKEDSLQRGKTHPHRTRFLLSQRWSLDPSEIMTWLPQCTYGSNKTSRTVLYLCTTKTEVTSPPLILSCYESALCRSFLCQQSAISFHHTYQYPSSEITATNFPQVAVTPDLQRCWPYSPASNQILSGERNNNSNSVTHPVPSMWRELVSSIGLKGIFWVLWQHGS